MVADASLGRRDVDLLNRLPKDEDGFVDWSAVTDMELDTLPDELDESDDDGEDEHDDEPVDAVEEGYGSCIFVSCLPVVPPEKHEKLVSVVRKIYSQIGTIREGACAGAAALTPVTNASSCTAHCAHHAPSLQAGCGCPLTARPRRRRGLRLSSL